jgi:hypothetical protein
MPSILSWLRFDLPVSNEVVRRLAHKWDTSSPFGNVTVSVTAIIPFFCNG